MSDVDVRRYDYDVCFSFAGEQRSYVEQVATKLRLEGLRVFYDRFETVDLWGKDLYEHLNAIYRDRARYCVIFVSKEYASKHWTSHERRSAQARAVRANEDYLLPARFDDTELPGLNPTIGYIDLRVTPPTAFAETLLAKLRLTRSFVESVPATNEARSVAAQVATEALRIVVPTREQQSGVTSPPAGITSSTQPRRGLGCFLAITISALAQFSFVFLAIYFAGPTVWRDQISYNWAHLSDQLGPSMGGFLAYTVAIAATAMIAGRTLRRSLGVALLSVGIGSAVSSAVWLVVFNIQFPESPLGKRLMYVTTRSTFTTIILLGIGYLIVRAIRRHLAPERDRATG